MPADDVLQAVQDRVEAIHDLMVLPQPAAADYQASRTALMTLLGPNPATNPGVPFPLGPFVVHGIVYQCDVFFDQGSAVYPALRSGDTLQGYTVALAACFAKVSGTNPLPQPSAADKASVTPAMQTLVAAVAAGDAAAAATAATSLGALTPAAPYDRLTALMVENYMSAFTPPDHSPAYWQGYLMGILATFTSLGVADYENIDWRGDFEEALYVYGDYEFADADLQAAQDFSDPFNMMFDPTCGLVFIPAPGAPGTSDPFTNSDRDWLHTVRVGLEPGAAQFFPLSYLGQLPPEDQTIINDATNGTGVFTTSGSLATIDDSWGDGDQYSGAWWYEQFSGDGTLVALMTALTHLVNVSNGLPLAGGPRPNP